MNKKLSLLSLAALSLGVAGCNLGMAPSGGSKEQIEANFNNLDPKEQIKIIEGSPASPEKKAQLIKDIKTKYNIKDDVATPVGGGTQSNPAPTNR